MEVDISVAVVLATDPLVSISVVVLVATAGVVEIVEVDGTLVTELCCVSSIAVPVGVLIPVVLVNVEVVLAPVSEVVVIIEVFGTPEV